MKVTAVPSLLPPEKQAVRSSSRCMSPKSCSPRKQAFVARELDPLLANLSPAATLEALKSSNAVDSAAGDKHRLLTDSIAHVSPSERALGIRAAVAARKLREWYTEVGAWQWPSSQFEPPSLRDELSKVERSHGKSIERVLASDQFVDDRYDMTYWGSLPATTVQEHEQRLEEIQDGMEALDLENLKSYIRKAHLLSSRSSETLLNKMYNERVSNGAYNRLDDFTVVITATIMQALPFLSRLSGLVDLWQTRLIVLRQVPVFLHQLEDAQMAMTSAKASIDGGVDVELTRDAYHTMRDVLGSRTSILAQTLDNMLDGLEERPDTIPDQWIDDMEDVEKQYQNWVVSAEQVVMANELNELRSVSVNSSRHSSEPLPQKPKETIETGSQSDVTAVDEDEQASSDVGATAKVRKLPPGAIKLSKLSGWAETEAIKQQAVQKLSRRSSVSYSDISEEPEVIETAQLHYVCLSPTVASPGIKPSLIEISSRSSKRSSQHSSRSSERASPSLTRTESTSTHESDQSGDSYSGREEHGVSGPPAVLAPWPPSRVSSTTPVRSQSTTVKVQESWLEDTDSEAEGGLRSYGTSSPHPKAEPHPVRRLNHARSRSYLDKSHSGPAVFFDDFFNAIVQPLSGPPSPGSRPTSTISHRSTSRPTPMIPSRTSSKHPKPRKSKSSRAVSSINPNLETQLNSRISHLLSKIPAPIQFFTKPEQPTPTQTDSTSSFGSNSPKSNAFLERSAAANTSEVTSSLKLAPNQPSANQTVGSSSRSAQSEVKLYHLHQPGCARPIKLYVRLVGEGGERVMVRVGGGWSDLGEYLHEYAAHHGRHATIDPDGADLELRDFPLPQGGMTSSKGKRRAVSGADGATRSVSLNLAKSARSYQSIQTPMHASKPHRHVSAGASTTVEGGSADAQSRLLDLQSSTSKSRRSTSASVRSNLTTPTQPNENESLALGPAGPSAKPKDISPKKKAWVEGVMSQARLVSGGGSRLIHVDDYADDRGDLPSLDNVKTRRVYMQKFNGKVKK